MVKDKRVYKLAAPLLGDSFLFLPDDDHDWKHQRKIAARGFHQNLLEHAHTVVFRLLETRVFPKWDGGGGNAADKNSHKINTTTVEMVEWATRMTLEVIGEVAFSCSFGSLENDTDDNNQESLYEIYQFMLVLITRRSRAPPLLPWFWIRDQIRFRKCQTRLNETIEGIVRQRLDEHNRQQQQQRSTTKSATTDAANGTDDNKQQQQPVMQQKQPQHTDLLSHLLLSSSSCADNSSDNDEDGYRLSYKYLFGNTRMFLFAGHDTTAGVLSGALWQLAKNPAVQQRLQDEIDQALFDGIDNSMDAANTAAPFTYKDVMQLKYLDAVVKEALRLHASAGVGRSVVKDVTVKNGKGQAYTIPAGSYVYNFSIVGSHYDELYPPKGAEFRPERFLDEETAADNLKNWYPFSYGPRNCVGQPLAQAELKTILVHVLHRYNLRVNAKQTVDPIPVLTLTVKPHQVLLDVERRH